MSFAPQVLIDRTALHHNLRRVRQAAPASRIWAVIKANGYGHGMERVAQALTDADGFAVARIDEAVRLRAAGIDKPLLVLEGVFDAEALRAAAAHQVAVTVHQTQQLELLEQTLLAHPIEVWLKVDSGMHRLGFRPEAVAAVAQRLQQTPALGVLHLMTHLANADDPQDPANQDQCVRFDAIDTTPFAQLSIANSAGLLAFSECQRDWVRPGIMLYGVSPFSKGSGEPLGLKPVMRFSAPVIAVNRYETGEAVGYGGSYRCPEPMPVAVIGVGYGDGYPRHVPGGTPVLLRGRRLPLVGRVSMDMICVDARELPDLQPGEPALLWGPGLPVEEIARRAGTIPYELLCGITGRVGFVEVNSEEGRDGAG